MILAGCDAWGRPVARATAVGARWPRCQAITGLPGVMPGWGCCGCRTYNSAGRVQCRVCGHTGCYPGVRSRVKTGTVLNAPTTQELHDLIAAKDAEMASLEKTYGAFAPTWVAKDSAAFVDWTEDWDALKKRYAAARDQAMVVITPGVISTWTLNATDQWDLVVRALVQNYSGWDSMHGGLRGVFAPDPSFTQQKGDLADLAARIQAAGAVTTPYTVPQPQKGSDADLNAMNTLAKLPIPGEAGFPWWVYATLGTVAAAALVIAFTPILGPAARAVEAHDPTPEPMKDPALPTAAGPVPDPEPSPLL